MLSLWHLEELMAAEDNELKILYLLSGCSKVLPQSYVKLRSYLNIHLSNLADQQNLKLPKIFRNRNKLCLYCYSPWNSDTSIKLLPSKKSSFGQGSKSNNEGRNKINELRNTLVLKCKVCSKKSCFSLVKRKPFREAPKEEIVGSLNKKKKKKKNKTCGLIINLKTTDNSLPDKVVLKKKKRKEDIKEITPPDKISQSNNSRLKNKPNSVSDKNLVPNPFATPVGSRSKSVRKNNKKLQSLKQAIKEDKGLVKKTLKDFLTLI